MVLGMPGLEPGCLAAHDPKSGVECSWPIQRQGLRMKIAVCIKQIPIIARVKFDHETRTIVREGVPLEVNSYDLLAVSAALKLVEEHGGDVTVLTMGPPQAKDALVQCLAMGADHAILLTDRAFAGADTLATARAISMALARESYDLIMCGKHSLDAETGQVGPEVAELLGIPQITSVRGLQFDSLRNVLIAQRETEEGLETVEAPLPLVLACGDGVAEEAFPSAEALAAAEDMTIEEVVAADLSSDPSIFGSAGSPTWVEKVEAFESKREPQVFEEEDVRVAVKKVVEALEKRGLFTGWGQDASADGKVEKHSPRNPHGAIWVVAETDPQGNLRPVTFELLGAAEKLANTSGRAVAAVIMGHGVELHTAELAAHGADIVFIADHPVLANYSTAPYTQVLADAIQAQNPFAVLLPATVNGRDLAARLAARLGLGLTGDCIDLGINDLGQLVQYKPAFGGNIVSPILSKTTPQMATVRPGMLVRAKRSDSLTAVVEQMAVSDKALVNPITAVSSEEEGTGEGAKLYDAEVVVGIGMGVGDPDSYPAVFELANVLNATVGATREVTDRGWLSKQQQIGITGKAISPKLYIALGVSGNLNHMVGVLRAGVVVAVNTRARAFVFRASDYGIVGDCAEVVPMLTEALKEAKARTAA
ncbi:MAG: FAD-binding protein [Chloroflexota bacterium]|nr:FAD-binding protein [Chloroflexota bacterium]